jgi:hypothetical protein
MKARSRILPVATVLAVSLALACSSTTPSTMESQRAPESTRASLPDLASMLSGRFQGTTPGNGLQLDLSTVGARAGTSFDLFLTASGRYRDTNVRRAGLLRLQTQGRDVHAAYVPHFDSTVTSMSQNAARFTQEELNAACSLYFAPGGDGFVGETRGGVTCAQAFPGAAGKWTVEVDPAGIRVRNVESGETLRFAKKTT